MFIVASQLLILHSSHSTSVYCLCTLPIFIFLIFSYLLCNFCPARHILGINTINNTNGISLVIQTRCSKKQEKQKKRSRSDQVNLLVYKFWQSVRKEAALKLIRLESPRLLRKYKLIIMIVDKHKRGNDK